MTDETTETAEIRPIAKQESPEVEKVAEAEPDNVETNPEEAKSDEGTPPPPAEEAKEIKPKKKRLTLQERLAMAAKKGSTSAQRHSSRSITPDTHIAAKKAVADDWTIPEDLEALEKAELVELVKQAKKFKAEKQRKQDQLESELEVAKRTGSPNLSLRSPSMGSGFDLSAKLEEKEAQIKDLLAEGQKLSGKEVSLTQTIKRLHAKEDELRDQLNNSEDEVVSLKERVVSLERARKEALQDSALLAKAEKKTLDLEKKLELMEVEIRELKRSKTEAENLRKKLKEREQSEKKTKKSLDEVTEREKRRNDDYTSLKSQLEREKLSHERALVESKQEIQRLETKLEELRYQTESKLDVADSASSVEGASPIAKSADGEGVLRGSTGSIGSSISGVRGGDILQAQYTQAQENWKLIESGYMKKVAELEREVEALKVRDSSYVKKVKVLTNDLQSRTSEIGELMETEATLNQQKDTALKQMKTAEASLAAAKESYKSLQDDYDREKAEFEKKMKELLEEKMRVEETLKLRATGAAPASGIPNSAENSFTNSFYLNDLNSSASFMRKRTSSTNIAFGESATTPQSQSQISFPELVSTPHRSVSGTELPAIPDSPIQGSISQSTHATPMFLREDTSTVGPVDVADTPSGTSQGAAGTNLQLVSRLSAHVRRLELEVMSLREENTDLTTMKTEASNEIVKLLKEAEETRAAKRAAAVAEQALGETKEQYEKTLELLGEKSERVGELEADVGDLKELMRQQVQQMVEMQSKIDAGGS